MYLSIRCPNERYKGKNAKPGNKEICGRRLKLVDRIESKKTEILICSNCGAQCKVSYNDMGGCQVNILAERTEFEEIDYPLVGMGIYRKRGKHAK